MSLDRAALQSEYERARREVDAAALQRIGVSFRELGDSDAAEAAFRHALEIDPGSVYVRNNLAVILQDRGATAEACRLFQRNVEDRPGDPALLANYFMSAQYVPGVTAADLYQIHGLWRNQIQSVVPVCPAMDSRDPGRRLRIGFLSAELVTHPVGHFLLPLIRALDRSQCRVIAFAANRQRDAMTKNFQAAFDEWIDVTNLTDADAARVIRDRRIDILIETAGQTVGNRLGVIVQRPAPIQMSWAGYVGTTGVPEIDFVLADSIHVPASEDRFHTERIIRMPRIYVPYLPPSYAPPPSPLPAASYGAVTFGSFNHPAKLTDQVVNAWVGILGALPDTRLNLRYRGVDSVANRSRWAQAMTAAGLDPARIAFAGLSSHAGMLAAYCDIDIALDPFPYSGGVTTLEALWMGVPVVTLTGKTFAGRHSTAYLSHVGLSRLATTDIDDYQSAAIVLATALRELTSLRSDLRARMSRSPMLDHAGFAGELLSALRSVWSDYCRQN